MLSRSGLLITCDGQPKSKSGGCCFPTRPSYSQSQHDSRRAEVRDTPEIPVVQQVFACCFFR